MGIMRLISRYGLSRAFDEWPENFPSLNFVLICLAIYSFIFALLTYIIYRNIENHGKVMDVLQQKAVKLRNYKERIVLIMTRYNRVCRDKNLSNKIQAQRLQLLEKQVSSLPTSVYNNPSADIIIERIVNEIDNAVSNMETNIENDIAESNIRFGNLVEQAIDDVKRLRTIV